MKLLSPREVCVWEHQLQSYDNNLATPIMRAKISLSTSGFILKYKWKMCAENIAYSYQPSLDPEQGERVRRACFHVSCSYDHLKIKEIIKLCDLHSFTRSILITTPWEVLLLTHWCNRGTKRLRNQIRDKQPLNCWARIQLQAICL